MRPLRIDENESSAIRAGDRPRLGGLNGGASRIHGLSGDGGVEEGEFVRWLWEKKPTSFAQRRYRRRIAS
jgi:hypothetical protein